MNRELSASSMSRVLPLMSTKSVISDSNYTQMASDLCPTRALFSSNSVDQYLWLIKGSQLDVICVDMKSVDSQRLIGSLDFCQIFNDNSMRITNVLQMMENIEKNTINDQYIYTLIVSLKRSSGGCLLCLIDVRLSVVIKTIECPFRITSIQMISSHKRSKSQTDWPLVSELLFMNGVIAIGTEGGLVFLLDLFLDNITSITDSLIPKKISFIICNSAHLDVKAKRKTASLHGQHICLPVNSDANHKNKFIYRADDGKALSSFHTNQVFVSSLHYIPQTAMLCIGFNFGGFQLYNMKTFKLECSCALEYGLPPVVAFAFQDPENDPKNYSYMWVIRGQEIEDHSNNSLQSSQLFFNSMTSAFMYSLCFESKQWVPNYGILYTGFLGCSCRFEYSLGTNPHSPNSSVSSNSRLIDCYTIALGNYSQKSSEDESINLDLSLLFISWEALSEGSDAMSSTYFAIFDLNQWYQSQMPTTVNSNNENQFCPYLGVFSLVDIANSFAPDAILSVKINSESIVKFRSQAFQYDIHYFPSSLSFQVTVLSESQICIVSYLGLQKRILSQMTSRGPNVLLDPKDFIHLSVTYGLLPIDLLQTNSSTSIQRELLLTVALENDCLPFLTQIIENWSSGELSHIGCDCKLILEWIWKRVAIIKNAIDEITYPLFNFSGQLLDNLNLIQLYAYESDLKSLNILLKVLQTRGAQTTRHGMEELNVRREVTQLVSLYLRVILWLIDCNLLPEHAEEEAYGENEVSYPASKFRTYYSERRNELHEIIPSEIGENDLLLIDGIVDSLNPGLSDIWKKGGGDGLYPPPNLHSLIGIFLLESVSLVQKQAVMLYSLLDLADFLSERQSHIVEKLKLFPTAFGLEPGLIKMVQGMWGLDHKLFDFALKFLLDPVVKPLFISNNENEMTVFNDLQQRIVTSFLYQNESKSALNYSKNCGHFSLDSEVREKLHLNMLLVNQQISRAFHYLRICRTESNAYDLLFHLFGVCDQMGVIDKIFKIPLDQLEEEVLTAFLLNSESPKAKHMLVLYLIINNKIIDAANVLNEFKSDLLNVTNSDLSDKSEQLILLVNSFVTALPQSLTNLAKEIATIEEKKLKDMPKITITDSIPIRVKPKALSFEWIAPSKAIEDVMEQIEDIWKKERTADMKTSTPVPISKQTNSRALLCQNSPFIRTPIGINRRLSRGKLSSNTLYPTPKATGIDSNASKVKIMTPIEGSSRTRSTSKRVSKANPSKGELLSILQTPQIKRKSPSNRRSDSMDMTAVSSNYFTPTSILKVKQLITRSTSPSSIASSPVTTPKLNPNTKTLQSTPLHHKLRFTVPDQESTANVNEDSVENARLALVKDTFMLKLKTTSKPNASKDSTEEMEINQQLELSTVVEVGEEHNVEDNETLKDFTENNDFEQNPRYMFSPPKTRSSAQKSKKSVRIGDSVTEKQNYIFSVPEQTVKTIVEKKAEIPEEKELSDDLKVDETITVNTYNRETPSRSPTPMSYVDDSDSHKSDSSIRSKVSSRSSRSSKTPTKKSSKKTETPTHTMKLRGSTSKSKPMD